MRSSFLFLILFMLGWATLHAGEDAATKIEVVAYNGWKDCYRLSNGKVETVIVPAVGRVMYFALTGGENILWEDTKLRGKLLEAGKPQSWMNFGGEKLWPAPQSEWGPVTGRKWPPDTVFDGQACAAEKIEGGVQMTTPVSEHYGAQAVRRFTLVPGKAAMKIEQWIEKVKGEAFPVSAWVVTQIKKPVIALVARDTERAPIELAGKSTTDEGTTMKIHDTVLSITNREKRAQKLGTTSREGWVAGLLGDRFLVQSHAVPKGATYPDSNSQAEIYTDSRIEDTYIELELLSPLVKAAPGEKVRDDLIWELVEVKEGEPVDAESLGKRARVLHAEHLKWLKADE